jgi:hypothetical protein
VEPWADVESKPLTEELLRDAARRIMEYSYAPRTHGHEWDMARDCCRRCGYTRQAAYEDSRHSARIRECRPQATTFEFCGGPLDGLTQTLEHPTPTLRVPLLLSPGEYGYCTYVRHGEDTYFHEELLA